MSSGIKAVKRGKTFFGRYTEMFDRIKEDLSCEFLIIGGGIAGLLAAKEINEKGIEVIVAEKNLIGLGRTAVGKDVIFSDGGLALEKEDSRNIKEIEDNFITLLTELSQTAELVREKSFKKRSLFIFSENEKGRNDMRRRYMIEKFGGKEAEFMLGHDAEGEFSFDYDSAVFTENAAATVNARSFAEKLASYLSIKGSRIAEKSGIVSLIPTENGFSAKTESGATVKAKAVIDARCHSEKRAVFSAKTEPTEASDGWPGKCVIRDTYNNRMTFYRTEDERIGMIFEKNRKLPMIFGTEHVFSYMQSVLSSMFFAIPNTVFTEKKISFEERTRQKTAKIIQSDDIPNLFIFADPYSNGILSALNVAKEFGSALK